MEQNKPYTRTAENFFKERFDSIYWDDKFSRKDQRFDFYDMIEFADQYASQFQSQLSEKESEIKELVERLREVTDQLKCHEKSAYCQAFCRDDDYEVEQSESILQKHESKSTS